MSTRCFILSNKLELVGVLCMIYIYHILLLSNKLELVGVLCMVYTYIIYY